MARATGAISTAQRLYSCPYLYSNVHIITRVAHLLLVAVATVCYLASYGLAIKLVTEHGLEHIYTKLSPANTDRNWTCLITWQVTSTRFMLTPPLYHLVYQSFATALMSEKELEVVLTQSRSWNTDHNLTGMLLYSNGDIMQVLEGTQEEVFLFSTRSSKILATGT
jgi:hypothetical protein